MSEEPSPASSSNSEKHSDTTSSPSSRNGREPRLEIRKQPPTHVYPNEWFEIEVALEVNKESGGRTAAVETDLVATLTSFETGQPVPDPSVLVSDPERMPLSTQSSPPKLAQKCRFKINKKDLRKHEPSAFVIRIAPTNGDSTNFKALAPVTTRSINVVRLKLQVKERDGWERVWYKDEGGREKCMTVTVGLYNKSARVETGEKVPLQLTLYYDNNGEAIRVSKQDIFRLIGSTRHSIDKKTGTATFRFRIEDVSKNHQGQEFKVRVAPDPKAADAKNIAPTYTPSVSIRSKRNKRQRAQASSGKADSKGPSPMGSRPPFPSMARGTAYPGDESGLHDVPLVGSDPERLREAMKGVINWVDDVVNGLYPLQWQVLGYYTNPDGIPQYDRPYHSMPNPNATISRVLSTYTESTRDNLRVLLSAVEKSSPGSQIDSSYLPPGLGAPFGSVEGIPPSMQPPIDQRLQAQGPYGTAGYQPMGGEGFREKRDADVAFGTQPGHMSMRPINFQQSGLRPRQGALQGQSGEASLLPHLRKGKTTGLRSYDEVTKESDVEYVLAKQFKALRTGERLGFPAYDSNKELVGFYRESNSKVGVGQFVPLSDHREDFGHMERMQATEILDDAIATKSEALHVLKEWGSISSLVDHAIVYDWTKEIGGNNTSS